MDKRVIHSVFETVAERYSQKIAIEQETGVITYSGLNTYANKLSHLLMSLGCERGMIVNVIASSSIEMIGAMLAVFKTGAIYLPVDIGFSKKRLKQIFTNTCDGLLIVAEGQLDELMETVSEFDISVKDLIVIGADQHIKYYHLVDGALQAILFQEKAEWSDNPVLSVNGENSNYIFYTSGSTGDGKAIEGKHSSLSHFIHWEIKEFGMDETFRISQLVQITFDASLRDIFTALISGATLCIPSQETKSNPFLLLKWLETSGITMVHCVPSLLRLWTKELEANEDVHFDFANLRYILMAGELIYAKDILNWRRLAGMNTLLVNLYGPTETTLIKTFYRIGEVAENVAEIIPVGVPISNTVIAIVKDGRICKTGERGEIYIKTPFMTKGYYKNEGMTNEVFVQNPLSNDVSDIVYKTGDLGRYLADGNIEVLGRLDNQVKMNGIRVELAEIERAILEMDKITGVVVNAHRSGDNFITLIAYYTGEAKQATALSNFLADLLNRQVIPSYFIHLDKFPLNSNGKIDRRALAVPEEIIMGGEDFQPPEGEVEIRLEAFFKEILGHKKIGRNISFFSIGGHSLRAIQLLSRIQKEFRVQIRIANVFEYNTIEKLAGFIGSSPEMTYTSVVKVHEDPSYPLSASQHRLWILAQLENGNVAFNMPGVYVFDGMLNQEALVQSFNTLIARHESLRTIFKEDTSGAIRQFVQPVERAAFSLEFEDLTEHADQDMKVKSLIKEAFTKPFDLASGPLLRAGLYRMKTDKWIFTYTMHHIISDGWSMNVLIKELLTLYSAYSKGEPNPLIPLHIQYKDYLIWREEGYGKVLLNDDKIYWQSQLEGELPVLELPTDKTRPAIKSYVGGTVHRKWDRELTASLKDTIRMEDCTMFTGLLAAVYALLFRYTNQEDIIVGSPFAGRDAVELENQIGMYVNTLPLRARFKGSYSYRELLRHVKQVTLGAYAHQQYPVDELTDELQLKRDLSRATLFDVLVVLQNNEHTAYSSALKLEDLIVSGYQGIEHAVSKFDLSFYFVEYAGELNITIEYNRDLFENESVQRFADHLKQIVTAAAEQPLIPINKLNYLSEKERTELLIQFNTTDVPLPEYMTIVDFFERQVERTPRNTAVIFEGNRIDYTELNEMANRFARYLTARYAVKREELIAVRLPRNEWVVAVILGIFKAGCAYIPLDTDYPEERISYMMSASGSKLVIDEEVIAHFIAEQHLYDKTNVAAVSRPGDLAYVIYTSGSTGRPKGAMIEHAGLLNHLLAMMDVLNIDETGIIAQNASFTFDISVWQLLNALIAGGTIVMYSQDTVLDPATFANQIMEDNITILQVVPSYLKTLTDVLEENKDLDWSRLKYLLVTGEAVSQTLLKKWFDIFPDKKVVNAYGPAEAADDVTLYVMDAAPEGNDIPVGKPIQNIRVYILDEAGMLCPAGIYGEICVSGTGVGRGYLNDEQKTMESFTVDPFRENIRMYKTGDMGKWLPDGNIIFAGRRDHQVKLRGYRIELGEIEHVLQGYPGIEFALVLVRSEILVAWYVSSSQTDTRELQAYLGKMLPAYMVPACYIQLDTLPLNANGKVDRNRLPDPQAGELLNLLYVAPENETEEKLTLIWQDILGTERIGINAGFFESGGHSLKITRLVSAIHKVFNVRLTLRDLFNTPVLREQALLIKSAQKQAFYHIPSLEQQAHYTLSSSQRRLWILSQFREGNIAYNITGIRLLRGTLNRDALAYAFNMLVKRHESLRTVFKEDARGEVRQFIKPFEDGGFTIDYQDVRNEHSPEDKVRRLLLRESLQPFNLATDTLVRASLYQTDYTGWVLVYTMHHIISDGWSVNIFLKELLQYYNAYVRNGQDPLSALRIQYRDYAAWQQEQLGMATINAQKAYWIKQFEGELPMLELPADKLRPLVKTYNGGTLKRTINKAQTEKLKEYVQARSSTLFMGLLAVVNTLLYRYTNQEDIIIGSPIAGREHVDLENQIGFYLNTLALRIRFNGSDTYGQLLEKVRQVTLDAYEHQQYPFEELVADLDLQRDMSRSSLFDVMVVLHNADQQSKYEEIPGLEISSYNEEENQFSKFDLSFDFIETGGVIKTNIEYNSDVYIESSIQRMADHFFQLLEAVLSEPDKQIQHLDYLNEEEKMQLVDVFNNTALPQAEEVTLIELFERQVILHPDGIALLAGDKAFTYYEVNALSNQLGDYLRQQYMIKPDDLVGIKVSRNEWMILAILGVLKSGAAYVPVDPDYPPERIEYMMNDSKCVVLIDEGFLAEFAGCRDQYSKDNLRFVSGKDNLAYVIYTSGSTGNPKGVMVTNGSVVNSWKGWMIRYGLADIKVSLLQMASISFDVCMGDICRSLLAGGKMVLCPDSIKLDPESMYDIMYRHQISILESPPGVLLPFIDYVDRNKKDISFLKILIFGSDILNKDAYEKLNKKYQGSIRIINSYGTTETAIDSTFYEKETDEDAYAHSLTPIGKPFPNTQIFILDDHLYLQPPGVTGEIYIGGDGLARGYLNRAGLTAERFISNPYVPGKLMYKTGDLGRWLPDGNILFTGRKDDQVKIRGYRIEPGEIESALIRHPEISAAVVVPKSVNQQEMELAAYIVGSNGLTPSDLRTYLSNLIPSWMLPDHYVLLPELPLTPNGKVDRRRLPDPWGPGIFTGAAYVAPRNEIEEKLVLIWQELLGKERIGVKDDFFDLGGHSLKLMRVVSRIYEQFGLKIEIELFFKSPFIEDIAKYIEAFSSLRMAGVENEEALLF